MNVVPRSTMNTNGGTENYPSKGNQGTARGKEKLFLTSLGIEPSGKAQSAE